MHHRYYDPQLGHFLNPDFRAPDIYDPTTFTEPYAYAGGNPMMFWDPNGLETDSASFQYTRADFESEAEYIQALLQFLSESEQWRTWVNPLDRRVYNIATRSYRNFDPSLGLFSSIETVNELKYQIEILDFILEKKLAEGLELDVYKNLHAQLSDVREEFTAARTSGSRYDRQIIRWDTIQESFWGRNKPKPLSEWNAVIDNYQGHNYFVNDVLIFYEILGLAYAGGGKLARTRPFSSTIQGIKSYIPRFHAENRCMQMADGGQINIPSFSFSMGGKRVGSQKWPFKTITLSIGELTAGGGRCKTWAHKIQTAIGGKIIHIVPNRAIAPLARGIGPLRNKAGKIISEQFKEHYAVRKGDRIYDRITGPEGMPVNEYKKLFDYREDLSFISVLE